NSPNVVTSLSSTKPDVNASHQRTGTDFSILIPPGEALIFKYNNSNSGLEQYIFPTYQNLTSTSIQAIDKSPEWLQNDLRVVLTQLSSGIQDKWANAIINAQDPYVDEIAFAISALSPEYLSSTYAYTEMLDINAEYIYKYDSLFNYVEIVDYGTSADEDYYTTASYKIVNGANDTVNIEIPKETYYWYVVHPQINSEIPAFVKPDQHESSATIGLTNPQNGVFWRTYMFEHNDTDIPNGDFGSYTSSVNANALITADDNGVDSTEFETLAQTILDSLQNIEIYWDSIPLGVASPYMMESYYPQNALALINRYAWSCGRFWSVGAVERPHQPVRILKWGIGRCGEYEDLTVALGRTALIPVTGIEGLSSDHVFNCFYDPLTQASNTDYNIDNWKVWETTITGFVNSYINHDGNGGRWASLNFMRSDGFTYPIIEQFSNGTGTLTINVRDEYAKPIDGAHVVIAAKSSTTTDIYLDNAGTTDQNGQVIFRVGDQRVYYAKVFAEGQETPTGNSVSGVSNNQEVQDGQNYSSTFT
ncbi:MAG: hypothetical protein U9R19_17625, partial [Bacteroidota bacterium]|nr:hypothetical protein [Bacteroidota bacterium]